MHLHMGDLYQFIFHALENDLCRSIVQEFFRSSRRTLENLKMVMLLPNSVSFSGPVKHRVLLEALTYEEVTEEIP